VVVQDGRFEVELELGLPLAQMEDRWLQIEVAAAEGAPFEVLPLRQPLDPKLASAATCWDTRGNAGTDPAQDFLGTTDAAALTLRAGNQPALRIVPAAGGNPPNLILGSASNSAADGFFGMAIGGGGAAFSPNLVAANYGTIAGGRSNEIADAAFAGTIGGGTNNRIVGPDEAQVVGGGQQNMAVGSAATVPGGSGNVAGGDYSFAAGYYAAVRGSAAIGAVPGSGDATGDRGTFVWSDATSANRFVSTANHQFLVRSFGGVGINTNAPKAALHVRPDTQSLAPYTPDPGSVLVTEKPAGNSFITIMGSAQRGLLFGEPGSVADGGVFYDNAGSNAMEFRTNGNLPRLFIAANGDLTATAQAFKPGGGAWAASSDARLKRDVAPLEGALGRLLALRGVRYAYRDPDPARRPAGEQVGFIAQEVQPLFPNWVATDADGFLTVAPQGFEALAVEALRELAEENTVLRADNEVQRRALASLQDRLQRIEGQLRRGDR
jgi:hypothetical protein